MDRYLIVIMLLLFAYSVTAIFMSTPNSDAIKSIDTIVRTTMASIFGYFISSNFIKNETGTVAGIVDDSLIISPVSENADPEDGDITITSTRTQAEGKTETREIKITGKRRMIPLANELQINVIGLLCVCSFIVLFSVRIMYHIEINEIELISQLRDIICGSVGFLIGMPSESIRNSRFPF